MKLQRVISWSVLLVGGLVVGGCGGVDGRDGGNDESPCQLAMPGDEEPFYDNLGDYCFFEGQPADQQETILQGVVPYAVRSKLYSDESDKFRFVVLPEGEKIEFHESDTWSFPDGTIVVKTFYYPYDARAPDTGRRLLETRLLRRRDGEWNPAVYLWNEEQAEAIRHQIGKDVEVEWTDEQGEPVTTSYRVPDEGKCKSCHSKDNTVTLIGLRSRQMNRSVEYADGTENQISEFKERGMFDGDVPAVDDLPKLPDPKDESLPIEKRARSYLEGNCAHCHRPGGAASNSALFVNWRQEDRRHLGVCKEPPAAGSGTGGREYTINPGNPDKSIMTFRMNSSEPGIKMPELPLRTVDTFGVGLVAEWISQMRPKGCGE